MYSYLSANPIPITVVAAGAGIQVTPVTVGTTTTYTVATLGGMRAQETPELLPVVTPTGLTNLISNGVIQIMTQIYDDDNAYNDTNGIWTCPATGRYNLSFYLHLTRDPANDIDGWYNPTLGANLGMFVAGIVGYTGVAYYAVDTCSVVEPLRFIDITGSALGFNLTTGTQLVFKALNLSTIPYGIRHEGDVARMVIQRVF
jgi:hypothetical protein